MVAGKIQTFDSDEAAKLGVGQKDWRWAHGLGHGNGSRSPPRAQAYPLSALLEWERAKGMRAKGL